jgi:hypothetical protein
MCQLFLCSDTFVAVFEYIDLWMYFYSSIYILINMCVQYKYTYIYMHIRFLYKFIITLISCVNYLFRIDAIPCLCLPEGCLHPAPRQRGEWAHREGVKWIYTWKHILNKHVHNLNRLYIYLWIWVYTCVYIHPRIINMLICIFIWRYAQIRIIAL